MYLFLQAVIPFKEGPQRLEDPIYYSPHLRTEVVQKWLQLVEPAEQLLNQVLQVVHPEMWTASQQSVELLRRQLRLTLPCWPSVYPAMDVITNRVTPPHCDQGGAVSFYDHLVSLGTEHDANLHLNDLHAQLAYPPGTSLLFTGKVLMHEVPKWSVGERWVLTHYAKDDVQERLGVARPALPSQLSWWNKYS